MARTDETRVDLLLNPDEVEQLDAIKQARGMRGRNAALRALIYEETRRDNQRQARIAREENDR